MQSVIDRSDEILTLLGALYALVCAVVALTPTARDDTALTRFMQRISFLSPRNVPGVFSMPGKRPDEGGYIDPMLIVLLCFAPLLGACGKHELRRNVSIAEAMDTAITADAVAFEAYLRRHVHDRVMRDCATAIDWEACSLRVAQDEADRVERWEASHNAAVASRDLFVAALRGAESDTPIKKLLNEAGAAVFAMVEVANSFGAHIDLPALILKVVQQ